VSFNNAGGLTPRRCWEIHEAVGGRFESELGEATDVAVCAMAIKRLQELSDRWLNDPELTGVLRAIICVMIKTALLKEHVVSLEHGSSSISTILDLLDDYSATVLGLFASGEVIFFSDMSTTVLSMPVMLCYHVSCPCPRPLTCRRATPCRS
jgi:hypothetical protein